MKRNIIFILLTLFVAVSCIKDTDSSTLLEIKITLPDQDGLVIDLTKINVKLQNKSNPFSYEKHPDAEGHLSFTIQPGKYDILASAYYQATKIAVNASKSEFILTGEGIVADDGSMTPASIELPLDVAKPNPLIIREFYYHGSKTFEGAQYTKDQYVEIYNNAGPGGGTYFLDSLCLATIFPANSTTGNNAWKNQDTIAIFQMFWMFPGTGKTYPLAPGESCVIALRAAVDHSSRATSGLHLEKAHFGCYDDQLTGHEIAAGVPSMICYMAGQGTAWGISINSPAFVLFKPSMGVTAYRADAAHWERYEPGKTSGTKYWHIAKSWIMDGVECVDSPEGAIKRLPSSVDAFYTYMRSDRYSGKCITRKLENIYDGVGVFQDTNNSSEDFIPDSQLLPRLKN